MAYEPVTPAQFKEAKPQFAAVSDATVQMYLDMAARVVDKTWLAADYKNAIIAFACHLMTMDGLGTDSDSQAQASGAADYQSIKSGNITLTRYRETASDSTSFIGWLQSTKCGRYYALLLQMNKRGPRVIMGGVAPCASPYAKDHAGPAYGWPGVFY